MQNKKNILKEKLYRHFFYRKEINDQRGQINKYGDQKWSPYD
jgi:hypothetical protein